ncbi:putative component of type VI protein secretion system [Bacillus sp. OAE603]
MEQPIRLKDNGQINVVLNTMKRGEVSPNSIVETVQKPKHELLVEIDEQLRHLIGMEEIKTMIHEYICLDLY